MYIEMSEQEVNMVLAGLNLLGSVALDKLEDVRDILTDHGKFPMPLWRDVYHLEEAIDNGERTSAYVNDILKQVGVPSFTTRGTNYIVTQYVDGTIVCSCPHYQARLIGTADTCKHIDFAIQNGLVEE